MNRIILSLDNIGWTEALDIIYNTKELVWGFKFNSLIYDKYGVQHISSMIDSEINVMADVKLYDIPSTMDRSIKKLSILGCKIITVHASSFYEPNKEYASNIAGVTVLTSLQETKTTRRSVYDLTRKCKKRNYGYIVCSPKELHTIESIDIMKICPGIRLKGEETHDQKRISTPGEAIESGANLLVIGRSILESSNMVETIKKINGEIYAKL